MRHAFALADGTGRTYQAAQMAAHATTTHQARLAGFVIKDDGLMTAIAARYLASATAHAQFLIKLRVNNSVAIKRIGMQE